MLWNSLSSISSLIIGLLSSILSSPCMNPSAPLVKVMGSLSLEDSLLKLPLSYQSSSLSLCQSINQGIQLPWTLPPPSSPTPLKTQSTHTTTQLDDTKKKCRNHKYGLTKSRPHCWPSSPPTKAKLQAMSLFWKLEGGVGLLEVMDCFQKALDLANVKLEHDVMGCPDCWVNGDIVYCARSWFHPNHPYHKCPSWQSCYCLAPEFGGLSEYPDHMCQ